MQFGPVHVDFIALGQALLGLAAVITAWKGRQVAKEKVDAKQAEDSGK